MEVVKRNSLIGFLLRFPVRLIKGPIKADMLIAGSIVRIHLLRRLRLYHFMERQLVAILPRRQQSPVIPRKTR